jgi:hypothetical protein
LEGEEEADYAGEEEERSDGVELVDLLAEGFLFLGVWQFEDED